MPPVSDPALVRSFLVVAEPSTVPLKKLLLWPKGPLAKAGLLNTPWLLTDPCCHAAEAVVYLGPACLGSP